MIYAIYLILYDAILYNVIFFDMIQYILKLHVKQGSYHLFFVDRMTSIC